MTQYQKNGKIISKVTVINETNLVSHIDLKDL